MNKIESLNFILNHYGNEKAIEQAIEECSELILALQKLKKHGYDYNIGLLQVYEEVADVSNMVEQLKMIFNRKTIKKIEIEKIIRELNRITTNE